MSETWTSNDQHSSTAENVAPILPRFQALLEEYEVEPESVVRFSRPRF